MPGNITLRIKARVASPVVILLGDFLTVLLAVFLARDLFTFFLVFFLAILLFFTIRY